MCLDEWSSASKQGSDQIHPPLPAVSVCTGPPRVLLSAPQLSFKCKGTRGQRRKMWFKGLRIAHVLLGATVGLSSACMSLGSVVTSDNRAASMMMYDFRTLPNLSSWVESSDTVREPGMSKGAFVLQKTQLFQRAVMFSMINPQPNGAGFVGFESQDTWDLSSYNGVELKVRGQGDNYVYKVNFRHNGQGSNDIAYEVFYEVPKNEWTRIVLPFTAFKPYYRGQEVPDAEPLNTSNITTVTLQIVGESTVTSNNMGHHLWK